jgi:hypothetical protein
MNAAHLKMGQRLSSKSLASSSTTGTSTSPSICTQAIDTQPCSGFNFEFPDSCGWHFCETHCAQANGLQSV